MFNRFFREAVQNHSIAHIAPRLHFTQETSKAFLWQSSGPTSTAETPWNNLNLPYQRFCVVTSRVACPVCFVPISFLSFDFKTVWMSARAIELTSEESLIYVNLWLLVCQVADQRQFTVGVEGGFESSPAFFFFLSRLGSHASEQHPPLWMFESAIQLQRANRWHSDKWWLGLFCWV